MALDELSKQLTALRAKYTSLADQAATNPERAQTLLPEIQAVNQQIAAVLDKMVTQTQYTSQDPNSEAYRNQLIEQLARIQMDYNGLKMNTDTMETLRRIRGFQDTSWKGSLGLYVLLLLVAAGMLVLTIVLRRQTKDKTAAPSASTAAITPLT